MYEPTILLFFGRRPSEEQLRELREIFGGNVKISLLIQKPEAVEATLMSLTAARRFGPVPAILLGTLPLPKDVVRSCESRLRTRIAEFGSTLILRPVFRGSRFLYFEFMVEGEQGRWSRLSPDALEH